MAKETVLKIRDREIALSHASKAIGHSEGVPRWIAPRFMGGPVPLKSVPDHPAPASGPASPAFVLLPGLGLSGGYLHGLARSLTADGNVWIVEFCNPAGRSVTVSDIAGSLGAWMADGDVAPVILVGHSFGAQVAAETAALFPELVGGLVLVSPAVDPGARSLSHHAWRLVRAIPREPFRLVCWAAFNYLRHPVRFLRQLRAALTFRVEEVLPSIKGRALVIHGTRDCISSVGWAVRVMELLPHGRLVTVRGHAHGVPFSAGRHLAELCRAFAARKPREPVLK